MCSEMMSDRTKALFFDIDGTLLSEKTGCVPDSTKQALRKARSKGHLVFINTGRVFGHLRAIRGEVEADGYLCGCGTYIMAEGKVLYSYAIPHERGLQIKRDVDECGLDGALEGVDGCYVHRTVSRMPKIEVLKRDIRDAGGMSQYSWEDDCYDFSKFYIGSDGESRCLELFGRLKDIDIIDRGEGYYECVPMGHSKATAIDLVLKHYGISLDEAYVFGDSSNDLSMFRYAVNCVLMGHHDEVLEDYATFVTKDVEDGGIAYAMKELGII